nr:uncharacterized protein LOC109171795 isoform X2 [Ipomoea batatas]GMD21731.1 uncharacterized protein LOC109171795 isoform X2 [Ipomoea batatas]
MFNAGVTTIAGGFSNKAGKKDGSGKDATFSNDYELVFIPQRCALIISDIGNSLVRQINLKPEDCSSDSQSALGSTTAWFLGVGISCLIGLIIGFVLRPYVIPHTGRQQTSLVQQDMEALPNESGETSSDALLRAQKRSC